MATLSGDALKKDSSPWRRPISKRNFPSRKSQGGRPDDSVTVAIEGLLQRLPWQRGALHAHGKLAHALQREQVAEAFVHFRFGLRHEHVVEALPQSTGLRARAILDLLRHQRGGGHANGAGV